MILRLLLCSIDALWPGEWIALAVSKALHNALCIMYHMVITES
jgi:hypothetical protein